MNQMPLQKYVYLVRLPLRLKDFENHLFD